MTEDVLGRKNVLVFSMIFLFIGGVCVLLVKNYVAKVFGILLFWMVNDLMYVSSYLFYLELSVKNFRNKSSTIFSIFYFFGGILGNTMTIYFADYKAIIFTTFLAFVITLTFLFFLVPQSPYLMLKMNKNEDLKKSIKYIMAVNKCTPDVQILAETSIETIIQSILFSYL